jgi:hypothetical protein
MVGSCIDFVAGEPGTIDMGHLDSGGVICTTTSASTTQPSARLGAGAARLHV